MRRPLASHKLRLRFSHVVVIAIATGAALPAYSFAGSGGVPPPGPPPPTVHGHKAKIVNGLAVAPSSAPKQIKRVIAAANRIAKGHAYCLGGGHKNWESDCYDCSGAVSYALHGGGLIDYPEVSGDLAKWGVAGEGKWITVYANKGHTFMMIAGRRFDTADTLGGGPGWALDMGAWESSQKYKIRQPA